MHAQGFSRELNEVKDSLHSMDVEVQSIMRKLVQESKVGPAVSSASFTTQPMKMQCVEVEEPVELSMSTSTEIVPFQPKGSCRRRHK